MDTSRILDISSLVLLFSTGLLVVNRHLRFGILLIAFQSLVLAFISFVVANASGIEHVYLASALTIGVKVLLATAVLTYVFRQVKNRVERGVIGKGLSLAIAVSLVLVSYSAVRPLHLPSVISSPNALPVAVSMVLIP